MTKLTEWLFGLSIFFGIYTAIITKQVQHQFFDKYLWEITILPLFLIFLLGIYAVTTVLYRTLTFNECREAKEELDKEILEARRDLISKGFIFDSDSEHVKQ